MFLKISPDLDMPLTSLDTKNYCPRLNGLGDIAIIANPIFFWDTLYISKMYEVGQFVVTRATLYTDGVTDH